MVKHFSVFRRRDSFVILFVSLIVYLGVTLPFGYYWHLRTLIFTTPDSKQYLAVANWLYGGPFTEYVVFRPFFYPLLLNLFRSFWGPYGVWFCQFLMWTFSGVLLYQTLMEVTHNWKLSLIGYLIYVSNLTLLVLTFHALTEVTVVFLITILANLVVTKQKYRESRYWWWMIFIAALLTATKPVYELGLIGILLFRAPFFISDFLHGKAWMPKLKMLGCVVLALLPVLVQILIMETHYGRFSISYIGQRTFRAYYLSKVYGEENNLPVTEARKYVNGFTRKEALKYLLGHSKTAIEVYGKTIVANLRAKSNFLNIPQKKPFLSSYMLFVNKLYFWLHVGMLIPMGMALMYLFKERRYEDLEKVLSLSLLQSLIFLTSGITFWQGDRIVLPSLPLWIVLYSMVLREIYLRVKHG